MNALVIIDTDALTPATVFAPGGVEGIISKLETDVRAIDRDISTPDGREAVKSLAYKIARSKTALDDMGKELVAGIKAQAATIDAERRTIRERLDALKDEVRGPLTAWETAEKARVDEHEAVIVHIIESTRNAAECSADHIAHRIDATKSRRIRNWQEFSERAEAAICDTVSALEVMLAAAIQREADAAELAELRRLKAEREESDRKAAEAAAAVEQARLIEEAKAAREAHEAAAAAERERVRAEQQAERDRHQAERAKQQAEVAAAQAVEQERQRAAAAKAAEEAATAKREANKKHRAKVHKEIAEEILAVILNEECAAAGNLASVIAERIATGTIPHISITY